MIQEIEYGGYTAQPSDYECRNGDLELTAGLSLDKGGITPTPPAQEIGAIALGAQLLFWHKGNRVNNLIIRSESGELYFRKKDEQEDKFIYNLSNKSVYQVNAIGNTLVVLTGDGVYYYLWESDGSNYKPLGNSLPNVQLSFGLQGIFMQEYHTITDTQIDTWSNSKYLYISEQHQQSLGTKVMGAVNKFLREQERAGRFVQPLLVRYALRLYDGTLTKHSAPILLVPNSEGVQVVCDMDVREDAHNPAGSAHQYNTHATIKGIRTTAVSSFLDYALVDSVEIDSQLNQWKDIVRGIEIFASEAIYTFDQSGLCRIIRMNQELSGYGLYARHQGGERPIRQGNFSPQIPMGQYQKTYLKDWIGKNVDIVELPRFEDKDKVVKAVRDCARFYHIASINIDELSTERKVIELGSSILPNLATRELMTDDYNSHDKLLARSSYVYNARLNLAGISRIPFAGFSFASMLTRLDSMQGAHYERYQAVVFIKEGGKTVRVKTELQPIHIGDPMLYLYYPNVNAYRILIGSQDQTYYLDLPLTKHDFLNGAYYFAGWSEAEQKSGGVDLSYISTQPIESPNKVYTSEVNNPFYFPVGGINTIGSGRVLALSSNTKAISEGQFGQFPLVAFTDEGIWALEVSSTGSYRSKQPISRDVCANPNSITQTDGAILFATDTRIMMLSGSTTTSISDSLDYRSPSASIKPSDLEKLLRLAGLDSTSTQVAPFSDFIKSCRMIYDYEGQRVIVYNPTFKDNGTELQFPYAYTYYLKSKRWGVAPSSIVSDASSYPKPIAVDKRGKLLDLSTDVVSAVSGVKGLVITRPIKLPPLNDLKAISAIIQRGYFKKGHLQTILYGSRDLFTWELISSSQDHIIRGFRGTGYKYFKLALLCSLDENESVTGCTVEYRLKQNDQPR